MKYSNYQYSGKNYEDLTFSWDNYFLFFKFKRGTNWKENLNNNKKIWSTLYSISSSFVSWKAEKHLNNWLQKFPCAHRWILSYALGREAVEYTVLICVCLREVMWNFLLVEVGDVCTNHPCCGEGAHECFSWTKLLQELNLPMTRGLRGFYDFS